MLTLPQTSAAWTGLHDVYVAPPDTERLQHWLAALLPRHDPAPVLEILQPDGALAVLQHRLLDIALLALTYPQYGLPVSRIQLYEWVHALLMKASTPEQPAAPLAPGNGRLHEASRSPSVIGGLTLRSYETARSLATAGNIGAVRNLKGDMRAEVALLLTYMLPDPAPLYTMLWQAGQVSAEDLLILGRCLREHPLGAPAHGLRVLEALTQLPEQPDAHALCTDLAPHLPAIAAATTADEDVERAGRLLVSLAARTGIDPLLELVGNNQARTSLRWQAGEALLPLPMSAVCKQIEATPPNDTLSQAIYSYILALGNTESRTRLNTPAGQQWLAALENGHISQQRRAQVTRALLSDDQTQASLRSKALSLMPHSAEEDQQTVHPMLIRACTDPNATVRHAALLALRDRNPQQAIHILSIILLAPDYPWEVYQDALTQLVTYLQVEASILLARCAMAHYMPLAGRQWALYKLAERKKAGGVLLHRLVRVTHTHPVIRSTIIRLLAVRNEGTALSDLCQIATSTAPLLVRRTALQAIGALGAQGSDPAEAFVTLCAILNNEPEELALGLEAMHALGRLGLSEGIAVLQNRLHENIEEHIRAEWLIQAPQIDQVSPGEWTSLPLPEDTRSTLLTIVYQGHTEADLPGNFNEMLQQQVLQMRQTAAEALVVLAHQSGQPGVQQEVRNILRAALDWAIPTPGSEAQHLLGCLAQLSEDNGLDDLAQLLLDSTLDPAVHWLVVEHLSHNPAAPYFLLRFLEQSVLDPFITSKLALALGQQRIMAALPVLRQLAEQRNGEVYLRMQAIEALGMLTDPAVETTLLHIVADVTASPALRAAAARALPPTMGIEMRRWLHELLSRERQPPELIAGVLNVLGRAQDHEALGLMLKYTQSEHQMIIMAALTALADVGDASIAANLVRVTQNNTLEPEVRLHAIGVLLRLCGKEYLSLLRGYLDSHVLSIQLQAFDRLMELQPEDTRPLLLLADHNAALALRLRAIEALRHRVRDHGVFCNVLLNTSDTLNLRVAAVRMLHDSDFPDTVAALEQCLNQDTDSLLLRRHCIDALVQQSWATAPRPEAARLALSRIAEHNNQPAEIRTWASLALVELEPLATWQQSVPT